MVEQSEKQAEPIKLTEEQKDIVQAEVSSLLPVVSGERLQSYKALYQAVVEGEVPSDLVPVLEGLVTMSLESGRARRTYRAEGERHLNEVFRQTPGGKELSQELNEINRVLARLRDHQISGLRVNMRTLGHFTIGIETDVASLTLVVRSRSVSVESVTIGSE